MASTPFIFQWIDRAGSFTTTQGVNLVRSLVIVDPMLRKNFGFSRDKFPMTFLLVINSKISRFPPKFKFQPFRPTFLANLCFFLENQPLSNILSGQNRLYYFPRPSATPLRPPGTPRPPTQSLRVRDPNLTGIDAYVPI